MKSDFYTLNKNLHSNELKNVFGVGNLSQNVISSALTLCQHKFIQNSPNLVTTISYGTINSVIDSLADYDLIHIHATYNLMNEKSLEEISTFGSKVILTLHDQRAFTGGCHYSGECDGYLRDCAHCPQVNSYARRLVKDKLQMNKNAISAFRNLKVVTPSNWLSSLASKSSIFRESEVMTIRNPIPDIFIYSQPANDIKKKNLLVGFAASSTMNPYKGFHHLVKALNILSERNFSVSLKVIAADGITGLSTRVVTEQITADNDRDVSRALKEIDWLIVPSDQDNLPNVIGEARMAGARVLGSLAGGVPEVSTLVTDVRNSSQFASAIEKLDVTRNRAFESKKAQELFGYENIGAQYLSLYHS